MSSLFDKAYIGTMELKNRFIRSATWEGMTEETGEPTEALIELYKELASGGVGLILTGFAYVNKQGKANPRMLGIEHDRFIPYLNKLTEAVHTQGCKIAVQVAHAGSQAKYDTGMPVQAPSVVKERYTNKMPVAMTEEDIEALVLDFAHAARRAKEAGFDAIQIHAAHGYLLSQFLSPYSNQRDDKYGGSIENRSKVIFGIYNAMRSTVGNDYPILIKINVSDFIIPGLEPEDSLWVCKKLSHMGIDAIELSGGIPAAGELFPLRLNINSTDREACFKPFAKMFLPHLKCPVILVCGLRSIEIIEELYRDKAAHFFSMSRPLISEPDLIAKWQRGDRSRAKCVSCNKCLLAALREKKLYCVSLKKEK